MRQKSNLRLPRFDHSVEINKKMKHKLKFWDYVSRRTQTLDPVLSNPVVHCRINNNELCRVVQLIEYSN